MSSRDITAQISSRSWELTNGGLYGKMPRPYIFGAGVLTFFRGCAIIRSLRSQGSRGIKGIITKGSRGITRDYKGYKRDYKNITLSYNTTIIQYYKRNKTHIYVF